MNSRHKPLLASLVILIGIAVGLVVIINYAPGRQPTVHEDRTKPKAVKDVQVFKVAMRGNQPKLEPVDATVRAKGSVEENTLRHFIEQVDEDGLSNPIPRGTRLLGLEIKDGLATVNLSKEFRDNFTGGSENEALLIGAILRTMGQFPSIKRVQLLVEGKTIDSLGHLELSEPLDVDSVGSDFGGGN